jgi:lipoprotein LprG
VLLSTRRRSQLLCGAAILAGLISLPGCESADTSNPNTLLADARVSLNQADSLHFHIDSDVSVIKANGAYLVSGDGDAKRPDVFTGDIDASIDELRVPVKILSVGGSFYIQRPFSTTWEQANPNDYGFSDPSSLLDPSNGLSRLLTGDSNVKLLARYRVNGEELENVSASVAGSKIAVFVGSADTSHNVTVTFGINASTHQLRQVILTNLYFAGLKTPVTYTITLTDYGKIVQVTPPE